MYILGAVNSDLEQLSRIITNNNISDSDILQLGDFGIGGKLPDFNKRILELDRFLAGRNINLHFIIGGNDKVNNFVDYDFTNIGFIENHKTIQLDGKKIFVTGNFR